MPGVGGGTRLANTSRVTRVSRASAGYSAIELLVVLTLAGTVAAMATPMSMSMVASYRLSGDAHSLSNSAATAKMTAAAQFTRAQIGRAHV